MYRFFRSVVIIFGCHLILHMRKASVHSSTSHPQQQTDFPWIMSHLHTNPAAKDPKGKKAASTSVVRLAEASEESDRIERAFTVAQRIGLPPPLPQDFTSMWYDPVATLNQNTSIIEMATFPPPDVPETVEDTGGKLRDSDTYFERGSRDSRMSFDIRYVNGEDTFHDMWDPSETGDPTPKCRDFV